jgi:hypothetical protein
LALRGREGECARNAVFDAFGIAAAKITLEGDALNRVIVHRPERASCDAFPAADAKSLVDLKRAIRACRASLHTKHLAAIQTGDRVVDSSLLNLDYPDPGKRWLKYAFMLERARKLANSAARTFAWIGDDYFSLHDVFILR